MPTYKTLYKSQFLNIETDIDNVNNQKLVEILIYDTESGLGAVESTIDLEPTGQPLTFDWTDNSEEKFSIFRSRKAEIGIFSTPSITIETFSSGGDNRFYVEIYYDSQIKLKGWLSISDLSQEWLPDPNEILLTATDGYNFLDSEPLKDFEGETPKDDWDIMKYLAWALAPTNLDLEIWVRYNIREESTSTVNGDSDGSGHFFKLCFLNAGTFETGSDDLESCKSVIEKILKRTANITQDNGVHLITRIDEITSSDFYIFKFDSEGNFLSKTTGSSLKEIGADKLLTWMNDDQKKIMERPVKSVALDFNFDFPKDYPCNIDFARGDFIADLPDEINADGLTENVKSYTLDCWQFLSKQGGVANQWQYYDQGPIANSDAYIKKFYVNGDEKHKELVIETPTASGTGVPYMKSKGIPLSLGDKIRFSIDLKYSNIGSHTGYVDTPVMVGLFADSGDIYWWVAYDIGDPTLKPFWQLTPPSGPGSVVPDFYLGANLEDDSLNIDFTSPPLPQSGDVIIFLTNFYADQIKAHYSSLSLDIISLINGSYAKFKSQQHKIIQATNPERYKGFIKDDVPITDAPRKVMKGAIQRITGTTPLLTDTLTFVAPDTINTAVGSGNQIALFPDGIKITTGATLNFGIYTIESATYHLATDNIEIIVKEQTIVSQVQSATISKCNFGVIGNVYDGALYPAGTTSDNYKRFGLLQAQDVWNQNNREMAKFEGEIDHLDEDHDILSIAHKYELTDSDLSTNGKVFMALHMRNNVHDTESELFLHEVFDEARAKEYPDSEFKFLT